MPALALTDLANAFGLVKFYKAARARGVKPIFGCDVWITHDAERDQPFRALLLAQSRAGYLRLAEWLTRAYRGNQHRGRAELQREWFDEGTDGLIALSGARDGDVGRALLQGNAAGAAKAARAWAALFPERYYLEVQRAGHADDEALVAATVRLAGELALPVVATHPVQFLRREDFRAHEARVCIAEGYVLADPRRPRHFTPDQYFKTQAEMAAAFADLPEALANAVAIAQRCNLTIPLGKNYLPDFPTPPGVTLDDHLRAEAAAGLERRLLVLYPDPAARDANRAEYVARLEFEIGTIVQMGFAGYFLIVADFINWAKSNGVPVGPGRGSGAGSLVAYALGITDLDPLRYGLLFERFLNPERVSMPDFDIDFCQDGRDRVIEYVKQKYGAESVSQIATFGTMAAKAAVRDVGRVLDLPYLFCDGIAKLIPFQPGKLITLRDARAMEPLLAEREQKEEEVRELLALAESLEGLTRNVGMHAGGVLIAPGKLTDFCPLYTQAGSDAMVSQFDKDDVEAIGLVKFDFLGLTTLTILDWTLRYVRRLDPASELRLDTLPLDDRADLRRLQAADTAAVFQFESRGMRDLMQQAPPTRFEDIIALVALYRPGPMELIPAYTARKTGRERVEYPDPRLEPILGPTYGVMVYQEQVMQIAQVIGGYTLGAADVLRRAMGKKDKEEMAKHRDVFVAGAEKNGLARGKATALFELMDEVRRLRLQQVARGRVRADRLPDRVPQGASPGGVHGGQPVAGDGRHRQGARALRRRGRERPRDPAARRQRVELPLRADRRQADPLRPRRDQGHRRAGDRGDRGRAQRRRAVSRPVRFLPARRQAARQSPRRRGADSRRRVRFDRAAARDAVRVGRHRALRGREGRGLGGAGVALRRCRRGRWPVAGRERANGPTPSGWRTRRPRSGSTCRGTRTPPSPTSSRRSSGSRSPRCSRSKEPVLVAGIVTALRIQTSRRGKMAIVTLDDGAGSAEIVVFNETFDAARSLLREDQLVVVEAKIMQRIGDDGQVAGPARRRRAGLRPRRRFASGYAKALRIACNGGADAARLAELLVAVSQWQLPDRRRVPEPWRGRRARAARRLARQPRRPADRAAQGVARPGERARGLLIRRRPDAPARGSRAAACGDTVSSCCSGARKASPQSARGSRAPRCRSRRSSSPAPAPTTSAC